MELPLIKSPFFNKRLKFDSKYTSVIENIDGKIEISVYMPRLVRFTAQLKSKDGRISNQALKDRILIRTIGNDAIFNVHVPYEGKYYLDIFVAEDWESESYDNACSFRINCWSVQKECYMPFPAIGSLGRTPYLDILGMSEESHHDPYIRCMGEELPIVFRITHPDVRLSHTFKLLDSEARLSVDYDRNAMLKQRSDIGALWLLRCPEEGQYIFSIYGSTGSDSNPEMPCLFKYLVDSKLPCKDPRPFPKTTSRWHMCKLHEPLTGNLELGKKIPLKIEAPRVLDMVAVVGEQKTNMKQVKKLWQCTLNTGKVACRALIYGMLDKSSSKYVPLLEFEIS